jgi:hypothetical protein
MNYRSQREEAIGNKYQGERENNGGGGEEQEGRGVRDERREKREGYFKNYKNTSFKFS